MSLTPEHFTGTVEATILAAPTRESALAWPPTPSRSQLERTLTGTPIPKGRGCMSRTALPWSTLKGKRPSTWPRASPSGSTPGSGTGMALHLNGP